MTYEQFILPYYLYLIFSCIVFAILYLTKDTMNEFCGLKNNPVNVIELIYCYLPLVNFCIIFSIALEFIRQWHKQNIRNQHNIYFIQNNTIETILDNK
jgi:hypothetical protein